MDKTDTNSKADNESYWIIDTSYNSNDKLILPYLLKTLNVIAITTVSTNEEISPIAIKRNIEKDIANSKIPVFAGADRPFINYQKELKDENIYNPYNWSSNLNINKDEETNKQEQEETNIGIKLANKASVKIAEFVRAFGKKVNIIALGPLTNLSLAILIDSSLENGFNNLYIVGGSYNNLGNSGTCAEFNFRSDPIASKNVILYYKNITLIPLEVEEQVKLNGNLNEIKETGNKNLTLLKQTYTQQGEDRNEDNGVSSFLGVISAILISNLDLIKVKSIKPCDIDTLGRYTRGAMLIEKYEHIISGKYNKVTIVDEIDANGVIKVLNNILN